MNLLRMLLMVCVMALHMTLSACSTADATPVSCLEKVAATKTAVLKGYDTVITLYSNDLISKEKALKALKVLDVANVAATNARPLCTTKDPSATTYIGQATKAMMQFAALTGGK